MLTIDTVRDLLTGDHAVVVPARLLPLVRHARREAVAMRAALEEELGPNAAIDYLATCACRYAFVEYPADLRDGGELARWLDAEDGDALRAVIARAESGTRVPGVACFTCVLSVSDEGADHVLVPDDPWLPREWTVALCGLWRESALARAGEGG
jgi:hypothetical protein